MSYGEVLECLQTYAGISDVKPLKDEGFDVKSNSWKFESCLHQVQTIFLPTGMSLSITLARLRAICRAGSLDSQKMANAGRVFLFQSPG
jgi:hypothetical protein